MRHQRNFPTDPRVIVGIDASSTKVALVAATEGGNWWTTRKWWFTDRAGPVALKYARRALVRYIPILKEQGRIELWLEGPVLAGARNIQSTIKQAFMNGVVQEVFTNEDCPIVLVSPTDWKKQIVGSGHASKEDCYAAVGECWPEVIAACTTTKGQIDQDLIDAAAICIHGELQPDPH